MTGTVADVKNIFSLIVRWYLLHERFLRVKKVEILGTTTSYVHYVAKVQNIDLSSHEEINGSSLTYEELFCFTACQL